MADPGVDLNEFLKLLGEAEQRSLSIIRETGRRAAYDHWRRRLPWRLVPGMLRARFYLRHRQRYREAFTRVWMDTFLSSIQPRRPAPFQADGSSSFGELTVYIRALANAVDALSDAGDARAARATDAAVSRWPLMARSIATVQDGGLPPVAHLVVIPGGTRG